MSGTTVGEVHVALVFDSSGVSKSVNELKNQLSSGIEAGTQKASKGFGVLKTVASGALAFVGTKIAHGVSSNLDGAIKRVDTLKNANRVFEAMGYAAGDVSASMDTLNTYLDGLPTSLDAAVSEVQLLAASFGGIENGTKIFKAMNDAGLAFGASSVQIEGAITQLSQLSMDGPLDAQTWNSLRANGFGPVLAKMAEQAGITVGELKEQFGGRGTRTVSEFIDMLVEMDEKGSGSMESLSSVARKNTDGIGTAMDNLNNRIQKAMGSIIEGIGEENIANIINSISKKIVEAGVAIGNFLKEHGEEIKSAIKFVIDHGKEIIVVVGAIGAALVAAKIADVFSGIATSFGNLKNSIGGLFGAKDAVGELSDTVNKAPKTFTFGESVSSFFENIGSVIGGAAQGIGTALTGLVNMIMEPVKALFKGVGEAIAGFFRALSNPALIMGALNFAIISAAVAASIWLIGSAIGAIMPVLITLFESIIKPAIQLLVWAIGQITIDLIMLTQQAVIPLINTVVNGINSIVETLTTAITTITESVSGVVDKIVNFVASIPSRVWGFIDSVRGFFAEKFEAAKNAVKEKIDGVVNTIKGIKDKVSGKIDEVKTKFSDTFESIKNTVKEKIQEVIDFITGIPEKIGNIGGQIGEKITGGVSGAISGISDTINGLLSQIPGLATGGYVKATPGGTLAVIGEGGEDEFVIPRSQMLDILTGVSTAAALNNQLPDDEIRTGGGFIINNHFTINNELDAEDIGRRINNSIRRATI